MPYELVSTSGTLAHFRMSGILTLSDITGVLGKLDELEVASTATPCRLIDISAVEDIVLNFAAMHDFAAKRGQVRLHSETAVAIVAATEMHYGCARMFQMVNQQKQTKVEIFRNLASARDWLSTPSGSADRPA